MSKLGWKNKLSGFLATMILVSSTPINAASPRFPDVSEKHWAYKHIDKMAELGYLKGHDDGKFYPSQDMTFMQAMAAFSRLRKPTAAENKKALEKYDKLFKELGVKLQWEKEALSSALYQDIVSENEVRNAKKANIFHKPIQKVAASVFLAKAMGLEEKASSLPVVFIDYKDVSEIKAPFRKYVKVLLDTGILEKSGDGTGNFNPKQALRREILATLMDKANNYILNNPIKDRPEEKPEEKPETKPEEKPDKEETKPAVKESMDATINRITREVGRDIIVVDDSRGREVSFVVDIDTRIELNGKKLAASDLEKGQEVRIKYDSKTRQLYSVEAESKEEKFKGGLVSYNPTNKQIVIEYNDGRVRTKTLELATSVDVRIDGKKASLSNLKNKDYVELLVVNGRVKEVYANPYEIKIKGEIERSERLKDSEDYELRVKADNKEKYNILAGRDTRIERDRKTVGAGDLRETDKVEILARYDVDKDGYLARDIFADIVREKVKGYVIQITNRLNKNPLVRVKLKDSNKEEDYELLRDAYIKVDGKTASNLPENPGYEVELYIEGKTDISEAYVDTATMENSIVGKIEEVNTRNDYIEILLQGISSNSEDKSLRIYVDSDTEIVDKYFDKIKLRDLYRGDYVNVVGVYRGANFVANTLQLRD